MVHIPTAIHEAMERVEVEVAERMVPGIRGKGMIGMMIPGVMIGQGKAVETHPRKMIYSGHAGYSIWWAVSTLWKSSGSGGEYS